MWNVSALKSNGLSLRIVSICWCTCFIQFLKVWIHSFLDPAGLGGQWFRFVARWFRQRTNSVYPRKAMAKTHWLTNSLTNNIKFSIMGIIGLVLKRKTKPLFAAFSHSLPILIPYIYIFFGWPNIVTEITTFELVSSRAEHETQAV